MGILMTKFKVGDIIYDENLTRYYRILTFGESNVVESPIMFKVKDVKTNENWIYTEFYIEKYCSLCIEKSINIIFKEA